MDFTDEEIEAIKYFEDLNALFNYNIPLQYTQSEYDYSKILLNMINRQKEENKKYKHIANAEYNQHINMKRQRDELRDRLHNIDFEKFKSHLLKTKLHDLKTKYEDELNNLHPDSDIAIIDWLEDRIKFINEILDKDE